MTQVRTRSAKGAQVHKHFYDKEQEIIYRGFRLVVFPNVFVPRQISKIEGVSPKNILMYRDKKVLDMGSGTGIQGIIAHQAGEREVVAVDINPWACGNTNENFKKYSVTKSKVIESDLFQNIFEKFDSIVAYLPSIDAPVNELREKAIYDPGFNTFRRFLQVAKNYLNKEGTIYACWVNIGGSIEKFHSMVKEYDYRIVHSHMIPHQSEEWWMFDLR